jgi:hypothetical protein
LFTVVNASGKAGLLMRYNSEQAMDAVSAPTRHAGTGDVPVRRSDRGRPIKQINAAGQQVPASLTERNSRRLASLL